MADRDPEPAGAHNLAGIIVAAVVVLAGVALLAATLQAAAISPLF